MDEAIVDIQTEVMGVSLDLGWTGVEDECGKVVCETASGAGVEAIKESNKGGGEEDKGIDASEVFFSGCIEALVDSKVDENDWWDCDTEGDGKGGLGKEDEFPTDPASVSRRTRVFGVLMVDVKDGRLDVRRTSDSVEG